MNLQRHLRTAHPSVQLEESVPSLLQLPSTDPGQVSCFEQSTSAAASTDLPKTAGILQPSVTQTKINTLQNKWLQPNTKVVMMKMRGNGEPFSTVEDKTSETFVLALKSVHVLPCRRSKGFYGNTSCLPTHKPFICLIRRKLKVVSDTKLKAIRDVFSKEAEPKEQSLWREPDLPSLVDIVWNVFGLKFKYTVCNFNTMKLGFKLYFVVWM